MSKCYTPRWRDSEGNVLIFPARNTLFESLEDAQEWQMRYMVQMIVLGLRPNGILELDAVDGKVELTNIPVGKGPITGVTIAGPLLDSVLEKEKRDGS